MCRGTVAAKAEAIMSKEKGSLFIMGCTLNESDSVLQCSSDAIALDNEAKVSRLLTLREPSLSRVHENAGLQPRH